MAAIEKVCECGKDDCRYYGGEMYLFKRNSLQINPECRDQFKYEQAVVFIVNTKWLSSDCYYAYSNWGTSYGQLDKKDDVWYNGVLYNESNYKLVKSPYRCYHLTPVKKVHQYEVAVVVGDKVFYNTIWDLRKFKINMKNMFGAVYFKTVCKKLVKKHTSAYELFESLDVKGSNGGFNNMVSCISKTFQLNNI